MEVGWWERKAQTLVNRFNVWLVKRLKAIAGQWFPQILCPGPTKTVLGLGLFISPEDKVFMLEGILERMFCPQFTEKETEASITCSCNASEEELRSLTQGRVVRPGPVL